jgi:hypothetical protein
MQERDRLKSYNNLILLSQKEENKTGQTQTFSLVYNCFRQLLLPR